MFNLFKPKKSTGTVISFKILDMHCTSCAINIDGALEELPGVAAANTSYAQAKTTVTYDPKLVSEAQLKKSISEQGYTVEQVSN